MRVTLAKIFLEVIQRNVPEGVQLAMKEHTEEDFKGTFKSASTGGPVTHVELAHCQPFHASAGDIACQWGEFWGG